VLTLSISRLPLLVATALEPVPLLGGGANPGCSTEDGRVACCGTLETVAKVGVDVEDGEKARWAGFRATGGAAFLDVELVVEVERRRSAGFGAGLGLVVEGRISFRDVCDTVLLSDVTEEDGLKGGGSLRAPFVAVEGDRVGLA
jgi:hypothetical protein